VGCRTARRFVVLRARVHQDQHPSWLCTYVGFFRLDGVVTLDERGHDAAGGLDTEGEQCDVEEDFPRLRRRIAGEDGGHDCGSLVWIDALVRLLEKLRDELDDARDMHGAADENDLVNTRLSILESQGGVEVDPPPQRGSQF